MGKPQRRKKQHKGDKPLKEKYRTKRKTKCIDQIHHDMKVENAQQLLKQSVDLDLPGNGQFYCLHCARYFITNQALKEHLKSKVHKRRLKALSAGEYSQAEAEQAAGMGSYSAPAKVKVKSQDVLEDMDQSKDVASKDP